MCHLSTIFTCVVVVVIRRTSHLTTQTQCSSNIECHPLHPRPCKHFAHVVTQSTRRACTHNPSLHMYIYPASPSRLASFTIITKNCVLHRHAIASENYDAPPPITRPRERRTSARHPAREEKGGSASGEITRCLRVRRPNPFLSAIATVGSDLAPQLCQRLGRARRIVGFAALLTHLSSPHYCSASFISRTFFASCRSFEKRGFCACAAMGN